MSRFSPQWWAKPSGSEFAWGVQVTWAPGICLLTSEMSVSLVVVWGETGGNSIRLDKWSCLPARLVVYYLDSLYTSTKWVEELPLQGCYLLMSLSKITEESILYFLKERMKTIKTYRILIRSPSPTIDIDLFHIIFFAVTNTTHRAC